MQIHQICQFDDSDAISTTYLGKTDRSRKDVIKPQGQFSITDQFMKEGTLLDGTNYKTLLDNDATQSFMSKQYYRRNNSLHGLAKFSSGAKAIQVGNGESVNILLTIPIIIIIQGHMFEIIP